MVKNLKAFTLAEVLITLGIIGVVASMTIPVLMQNIQDRQFQIAFKKAYSNISQAYASIRADNGGIFKGTYSSPNEFRDLFLNKMSYVKKCDWTETQGGCWNNIGAYNLGDNSIFENTSWWFNSYDTSAVLKDGTTILFDNWDQYNCDNNASTYKECGRIHIDVNGAKPPNRMGKDIFWLYVYENRIAPNGDGSVCNGHGQNCGSYYLFH